MKLSAQQSAILAYLDRCNFASEKLIAQHPLRRRHSSYTGRTDMRGVEAILDAMARRGLVVKRVGRETWEITPTGREAVAP